MWLLRLPPQEGVVEILVVIVIAVLVHHRIAHAQAHRGPAVGRATCADDGPRGYDLVKNKKDGCVRSVFQPSAQQVEFAEPGPW